MSRKNFSVPPNAEGLCDWCEKEGVSYVCPECSRAHCSEGCLTSHSSKTHPPPPPVPTLGERINDAIVVGFGFLARWTFFIASGLALLVYCSDADWSAFNTRFAELTITKVFGAFAQLTIVTLLGVGLLRWAFSSGPKKYRSWAKFVFWTCVWGVAAYVVFFGKR